MREFFQGWRKRVGCATLVMALVFTAAWMRSYDWPSEYQIIGDPSDPRDPPPSQWLSSRNGGLSWNGCFKTPDGIPKFAYHSENGIIVVDECVFTHWKFAGFEFKSSAATPPDTDNAADVSDWEGYRMAVLPYWSIVLPLTLLSAYLLLVKPRVAKPKIVGEK